MARGWLSDYTEPHLEVPAAGGAELSGSSRPWPLTLKVIDDYAAGNGKLEVRILGLPIQRQRGRETVIGEALRYLAELPWAPYAMADNRDLEWRRLDDASVEVATLMDGERLAVNVEFDDSGDIFRTSSQMRLFKIGKTWLPRPWAGDFSEYALVGERSHSDACGGVLGSRRWAFRLLARSSHLGRVAR